MTLATPVLKLAQVVCVSKLGYADNAALIDEDVEQASARVTSIAKGFLEEAAMVISIRKSKVMRIHKKTKWVRLLKLMSLRPI